VKVTKNHLKELIKQALVSELQVFGSRAQYDAYKKKTKIKPGTKVKVDGKITTVRGPADSKMSKSAKATADRMADKMNKRMADLEKKRKQGKIKESTKKRYTVKEVRMWMKKLEENRYKRVYNADVRRVAWMVNNEGVELSEMPMSFKKKWSKAQYGRERYLAKEFLQSKEEQMNESKLREQIRKIIKEQLNEGKLQTQFEIPTREQRKVMTILRKAKYKEGRDYDFGAARGPKFVLEVPKKLENKILSLLIQKDVRNIHEI